MRRGLLVVPLALAGLLGPGADATQAYNIFPPGRTFTGPTVTYHSSVNQALTRRVVGAANSARIGVKLRRTSLHQAQIRIRSGNFGCGHGYTAPGPTFDALGRERYRTEVVIARGCNKPTQLLTTTHEMGHALGLGHETRGGCSIMHITGRACQNRILFSRLLFQRDDIRGMRHVWRNRPPRAAIGLEAPYTTGEAGTFADVSTDGEKNIVSGEWDFGDPGSAGNIVRTSTPKGFLSNGPVPPQVAHAFSRAGLFTVKLTVVDSYGKRSTTSQQVSVAAADQSAEESFEESFE